jgi:hypothetical protein
VHSSAQFDGLQYPAREAQRSAEEIRRSARATLERPARRQLQDPEWYVNLQRRWGKEKARNFLKALAAQQPGVRDGHNITAQLLAAGEFQAVSNTYAHIAARIKGQGGPVQYVFDEPVITYVHPIALMKGAPHPNAGKLADQLHSFRRRSAHVARAGQDSQPSRGRSALVFSLRNVKLQASDPRLAKEYSAAGDEMRAHLRHPMNRN